ncbi:MAG: hypothetical protein ACR2HH_03590 [Chthoniobacterales bacterium]
MGDLKVVPTGAKQCKPFILEVFVASPETGYKFALTVEKMCSSTNDPLWKLVFDLYKKDNAGVFQQLVHVSFTPTEPNEQKGVEALATEPVNVETARVLRQEVHPAARAVAGTTKPSAAQKKKLHDAMSKAAQTAIEV